MRSVPFEIKQSSHGLSQSRGVVYVEEEHLVFEVQTTLLGFFRAALKTYQLDLTDLEEVRYKRGLLRDLLTITTRPLDLIMAIPGAAAGVLSLHIKRGHRDELRALLDRLDLWRPIDT